MAQAGRERAWPCAARSCLVTSPAIFTRDSPLSARQNRIIGIGRLPPAPLALIGPLTGVDARERRLSGRPVTNSRSTAVNIAAVTIFVTFAAAALVCVVLGAHRRVVLGLRVDRAAPRQLLGAAHSRTMA